MLLKLVSIESSDMMQFFRVAGGSLASMYAILLVFWYVASKFTEIVRLDEEHQYTMEKYGFFTYMYACGIAYITYILTFVLQKSKFVENQKVSKVAKLSQTITVLTTTPIYAECQSPLSKVLSLHRDSGSP